MSQLDLFSQARQNVEVRPDNRHDWLYKPAWGGSQADWLCLVCGERASVSAFTGKWVFFRPQLAKQPRGAWHYDVRSHECEPREWQ